MNKLEQKLIVELTACLLYTSIGTVWGIPEDAEKPADARIKNGKYIKKPAENEK